jgi:hypothetical protein
LTVVMAPQIVQQQIMGGLAWGTVRHGVIASLLMESPAFGGRQVLSSRRREHCTACVSTEPKRLDGANHIEPQIAHL